MSSEMMRNYFEHQGPKIYCWTLERYTGPLNVEIGGP